MFTKNLLGCLCLCLCLPSTGFAKKKTPRQRIERLIQFLVAEEGGVSEYLSKRLDLKNNKPHFDVSTLKVKSSNPNRDTFHVYLNAQNNSRLGVIRLKMSVPAGYKFQKRLPTLLVLGGVEENSKTIDYFSNPGNNILIGYDYPFSNQQFFSQLRRWEALDMDATDIALLSIASKKTRKKLQRNTFKKFDKTFGQVASLIHWIHGQNFVDQERVSFVAISFGSFIIPASFQLAEHLNEDEIIDDIFASGVFIQGAGTILPFFQKNISSIKEKSDRRLVKDIIAGVSILFNPTSYLPKLIGPKYFVISSREDNIIPWRSSQALYKSLKGDKERIILDTPHVGKGKGDVLLQIEMIVKDWMLQSDLINE